ncbi:MAG: hypothetical protein FE834_06360, partial [Gammaproteobacteria bacterium]|nr:hypothetical protein [Gammaproteobacteria bacterium]
MKKTIVLSLLVSLLCVTGVVQAKDFALFDDTERGVQFFDGSDVGNVGRRITTSGQIKNAVVGDVLTLSIEGKDYRIVISKRNQYTADIVNLVGYIEGSQYRMMLTRGVSGSVGTIETAQGGYDITTNKAGEWLISPNDKKLIKRRPFKDEIIRPRSDNTSTGDTSALRMIKAQQIGNANSTDKAEIDVMIFWDQEFESRVGGANQALTALYGKIATINQAFSDSDIYIDIKLVHSRKIAYNNNNGNLDALKAMQEGKEAFANVATLRASYGADLVGFIRENNESYESGGVAYVLGLGDKGSMRDVNKAHAFFLAVDDKNDQSYSNKSFMHEIGHNLGSLHDRNHVTNGSEIPIFPYSYGHDDCLNGDDCGTFGTIMSYDRPAVAKFSNPSKTCNGKPCGVASGSNASNNAKGF